MKIKLSKETINSIISNLEPKIKETIQNSLYINEFLCKEIIDWASTKKCENFNKCTEDVGSYCNPCKARYIKGLKHV